MREHVVEHLGDPAEVLIVDDTGFLKEGTTVGRVAAPVLRDRCRTAGSPKEVKFATKVQMARTMLARALDAGVPAGWLTMDEAYGQSKSLPVWLEHREAAYVVAARRNDGMITTTMGTARADQMIVALPARAWCRLSAGAGAHGPREYCPAVHALRRGMDGEALLAAAGDGVGVTL
ncbi:DDE superfamily endonuclease [Micromonospora echinospora]|uniref:DDE superfamily endonuclease n=1 Tax=Micromonospora echinospora TaxID=1877 RepID=A0A1C4WIV4_MICEC|nr:DDE superfamily endonuclease [Micromonospora echinospora]